MCVIAIKPADKPMFPDSEIILMYAHNHDGAGLMYRKRNGKVHIEKGFFKVEDLLQYIHDHQKILDHTDVVLHFRIKSSGKITPLACHPYPVWNLNTKTSCDVDLAMAHNGMLERNGWVGNVETNDTETFIKECLRKLPHNFLKNIAICDLIAKSIGTNRLAFMDKDGVKTFGTFIEENGYHYSNLNHRPVVKKKKAKVNFVTNDENDLWHYASKAGKSCSRVFRDDESLKPIRSTKGEFLELMNDLFGDETGTYKCSDFNEYDKIYVLTKQNTRLDYSEFKSQYYDDEFIYRFNVADLIVARDRLHPEKRVVDDGYDFEEID